MEISLGILQGKEGGNILIDNSPLFLLRFRGENMRKLPRIISRNSTLNPRGTMGDVDMACPRGAFSSRRRIKIKVKCYYLLLPWNFCSPLALVTYLPNPDESIGFGFKTGILF